MYYRHWNIVVQDWLYAYIYKDVYEKMVHSKVIATLSVFFVSAIFHEYIIAFSLRFFYPVLLLLFGGVGLFLVLFARNNNRVDGNIFLWFSLITGNSIIFTLYSMEYNARRICPAYSNPIADLLLPRSWICYYPNPNEALDVS